MGSLQKTGISVNILGLSPKGWQVAASISSGKGFFESTKLEPGDI